MPFESSLAVPGCLRLSGLVEERRYPPTAVRPIDAPSVAAQLATDAARDSLRWAASVLQEGGLIDLLTHPAKGEPSVKQQRQDSRHHQDDQESAGQRECVHGLIMPQATEAASGRFDNC